MKRSIKTDSPEATEQFAEKIGQNLKGGEVIDLSSDLGGGKTTFVRGLAAGIGSTDRVASPTFTISKIYKSKTDLMIYHFDFYRLREAGLMAHELHDALNDPSAVIVVEWSGVVNNVLPLERISIKISVTGDTSRDIDVVYPKSLEYLATNI